MRVVINKCDRCGKEIGNSLITNPIYTVTIDGIATWFPKEYEICGNCKKMLDSFFSTEVTKNDD